MEANFLDYEILGVISDDTSYKVKCKKSGRIYVWKVINFEDNNRSVAIDSIVKRCSLKDDNLLKFYGYIQHKDSGILYAMIQYCKFGSLFDVIANCKKRSQHISETFLWNILFKITQALKTCTEINPESINVKNVYLNKHCDIKFYSFNQAKKIYNKNPLGVILHQLVTLTKTFDENTSLPTYYSNCFRSNISYLLNTDVKNSIDVILCHPSVISASSQKNIEIFISTESKTELNENSTDTDINLKIENLKNREIALLEFEKRLQDKERSLMKREKKILRLERTYHEKQKKELLKQLKKHGVSNKSDEEEESLYANCDDSLIVPTSKKLDFVAPMKFSRSLSERRVRFKGHSPLKEIHNIPPKNKFEKAPQTVIEENSSDKSSETCSEKSTKNSKKRLSLLSVFSKQSKAVSEPVLKTPINDIRPISWTEETKKQAYDLLRAMNHQESGINSTGNIQHTCL